MKTMIQTVGAGILAVVCLGPFQSVCGQESRDTAAAAPAAKASTARRYQLTVEEFEMMQSYYNARTNAQRSVRYTPRPTAREHRSSASDVHAVSALGHVARTSLQQRSTVEPRPSSDPYGYRGRPATHYPWAIQAPVPPRVPVRSIPPVSRSARGIGWLAALLGAGAWGASRVRKG